jgi:C-terminal processing protease CtpA/Prc
MGNSSGSTVEHSDKVGYRVLGVQPESPAAKGGLVSFFDFIVSANGVPLRSLDTTFIEIIKVDYSIHL